jgi:polar amino acid transport system substrate-binding protein
MRTIKAVLTAVIAVVLGSCASVDPKPSAEAKAALAPTGKLRVGVYLGNPLSVVRDSGSQQMKGVGFDLGQQLAQRMEVPFEPVVYPSVGALLDGAKTNQWDVALFQISPARAKEFDFTPPIVEIELGYLIPKDSRMSSFADADTAGMRIAVPEKGQSDVILSRLLKYATLVRVPGLAAAVDTVKSGNADAIATIKPSLFELSKQLPESRVLDGRFATEYIAMAIPKGRDGALSYARKFVEEAKSHGRVKTAVEKAGARGAVVAPLQSAL